MGNNFEQDFMKNVRSNTTQTNSQTQVRASNKNIIIIILALVILIEAIAVIILALQLRIQYENTAILDSDTIYVSESPEYTYDSNNLIATMSATCESNQGYYIFYPSSSYEKYDINFEDLLDQGTYTIIKGQTLMLTSDINNQESNLGLNDGVVSDGDSQYVCNSGALDNEVQE